MSVLPHIPTQKTHWLPISCYTEKRVKESELLQLGTRKTVEKIAVARIPQLRTDSILSRLPHSKNPVVTLNSERVLRSLESIKKMLKIAGN